MTSTPSASSASLASESRARLKALVLKWKTAQSKGPRAQQLQQEPPREGPPLPMHGVNPDYDRRGSADAMLGWDNPRDVVSVYVA